MMPAMTHNPSLAIAAALIASTIGAFTAIFAGLWAVRRAKSKRKTGPTYASRLRR
jgi:hypothetical protein